MDCEKIKAIAREQMAQGPLYVVDCTCSPANEVELTIDSDSSVSIEECVELSRRINEAFEDTDEDFSLTVSSAGIGQPLRVLRQYLKLIGRPVEVLLAGGTKILATLLAADAESITLSYEEKVAVEGKKRKQTVAVERRYPLAEVKYTREWLDFK